MSGSLLMVNIDHLRKSYFREAVPLALDHAQGFELADIGPAAIEVLRQCRGADVCGLWIAVERPAWRRARRSRSSASFLLRRGRIAHFRFRRHSGPCPDLPLANPVANDPGCVKTQKSKRDEE